MPHRVVWLRAFQQCISYCAMWVQVILRRDNFGFEDEGGLKRDRVEVFSQRRPRFPRQYAPRYGPRYAPQYASSAGVAAGGGGGLSSPAVIAIFVFVFFAVAGIAALAAVVVVQSKTLFCNLYINITHITIFWGSKNQSAWKNSGKPQPILTKFGTHVDICTKFGTKMQHDHAEMPTWSETEPEVNSHDVTSRTSVRRSRRLYEVFEPYLVESSRNREPSWRNISNSLLMKIEHGGGCHIEFQKRSIYPN